MNKADISQILEFAKLLSGKFSNKEQAINRPKYFANINIYFQPLPWELLSGPCFYSEQSYDYSPWSPYRQGVHKLTIQKNILILKNYQLRNPERVAGAGFMPELMKEINIDELIPRVGCSMHFRQVGNCRYLGKIEPGNSCLIERNGEKTYVISEVELNKNNWNSIDRGYDPKTNLQVWGAKHGPFKFKRSLSLGNHLTKHWLRGI